MPLSPTDPSVIGMLTVGFRNGDELKEYITETSDFTKGDGVLIYEVTPDGDEYTFYTRNVNYIKISHN